MKVLPAALLALLLCRQPGTLVAEFTGVAAQTELRLSQEYEGEDSKSEGYDDDEEEDEEETNMASDNRNKVPLECYICLLLRVGDICEETRPCTHSQNFCTTMVSHGHTGSGLLTTYSMWCTDACQPFTKTVAGTQMTQSCCQSTLCNFPPWQSPPGRTDSPHSPQGSQPPRPPPTSAAQSLPGCTALLLTLLASPWTVGA